MLICNQSLIPYTWSFEATILQGRAWNPETPFLLSMERIFDSRSLLFLLSYRHRRASGVSTNTRRASNNNTSAATSCFIPIFSKSRIRSLRFNPLDNPRRTPNNHTKILHVPRHHTPRPNRHASPNRNPRTNNRIPAQPTIFTDRDRST